VSAQGFGGRCNPAAGNLFDHYTVEFTFADGAKLFAFSRHMNGCWETYADFAHGANGSAVLMESLGQPKSRIYKTQNMVNENLVWEFGAADPNPYDVEWQVLVDAIRNDTAHNEARRAGEADVAALMGRIATHSGQMITWDQVMQSKFQFVPNIGQLTFDSAPPIHAEPGQMYAAPQPGITIEI
jgi:hypothetical protein